MKKILLICVVCFLSACQKQTNNTLNNDNRNYNSSQNQCGFFETMLGSCLNNDESYYNRGSSDNQRQCGMWGNFFGSCANVRYENQNIYNDTFSNNWYY